MNNSTLIVHNSKQAAQLVSLATLETLPTPTPMGRFHKPVPHATLVESLKTEALARGYGIAREQFALGKKGATLFGVLDLQPTTITFEDQNAGRGLSLGFRSSLDQSLAIQLVAGNRVFVCDNLAMSGDMIALIRKSTSGLNLLDAVRVGFDKFAQQAQVLEARIDRLAGIGLNDERAKVAIFDVFRSGIVPLHLFDDVVSFYFNPQADWTDCQPRSAWGLHNAFTRAFHLLKPQVSFGVTVALGKAFGLTAGEVIEGEVLSVV